MRDVSGRASARGLWTLVLVASLALSTWTLAPLGPAAAEIVDNASADRPPVSWTQEIFGPSASETKNARRPNLDVATSYAAGRGLVGLVVLDRQTGTYLDNGVGAQTAVGSASVIKVLIAEEILHRAWLGQVQLGTAEYARIETMLINSDDPAASSLYIQFGGVSLIVAALNRHELKQSAPPADPRYWGNTKLSAHDIAVFYDNVLDGSLPTASRDYLFGLLRRVAATASDGFGQIFGLAGLDPRLTAAVKQGWMCCLDGVRNVHSTAVIGQDDRYVVVILTQYLPSLPWEYGLATTIDLTRLVLDELTL